MFEGDLRKPLNKDAIDETLKLINKTKLPPERRQAIIGGINNARAEFTNLIDILNKNSKGVTFKKGKNELQQILQDRTANWIGSTYRIFEEAGNLISFCDYLIELNKVLIYLSNLNSHEYS